MLPRTHAHHPWQGWQLLHPQVQFGAHRDMEEQKRTKRLVTEEEEKWSAPRFPEHLMTGLTYLGQKLFTQFSTPYEEAH